MFICFVNKTNFFPFLHFPLCKRNDICLLKLKINPPLQYLTIFNYGRQLGFYKRTCYDVPWFNLMLGVPICYTWYQRRGAHVGLVIFLTKGLTKILLKSNFRDVMRHVFWKTKKKLLTRVDKNPFLPTEPYRNM